jgi:hypothetical protein
MQIDYRYWAVIIVVSLLVSWRVSNPSAKLIVVIGSTGVLFIFFSLFFALHESFSDTRLFKALFLETAIAFELGVWSRCIAAGYSLLLAAVLLFLKSVFGRVSNRIKGA